MPTILRLGGLRVVVYPNDHRPAHVHVIGQGHEAVFELNLPVGTVALRENYGFSRSDLVMVKRKLTDNLEMLIAEWEKIHGTK
jgi:hypothetical protein